ncbi:MAG TPA: M35 family metallo-endopeptidase [Caulobacteraceae bacterium]|jgi:hypothetical protein
MIMTYDEWMKLTRQGIVHPRSKELRQLDLALKNYTEKRSQYAFEALCASADFWKDSKDDPYTSIRNSNGAVTKLFKALEERNKTDKAGARAQQKAEHNIGRMNRPAGFLDQIRQGGGKAPSKLPGDLVATLQKAGVPAIVTDSSSDNVHYEGFLGQNLDRAKTGWADALRAAEKVARAMRVVQMGMATGAGVGSPEGKRYATWFGAANRDQINEMALKAEAMLEAMRTRPVTFVLRENMIGHIVNGRDPLGPMTDDPMGPGTYGFVWKTGANHAGAGMRIVCCDRFITKPCVYEGPAATIYHELTHKVLGTSDTSIAGVTTYGIADCKALAKKDPASARNVADCWSYYAISFLKAL